MTFKIAAGAFLAIMALQAVLDWISPDSGPALPIPIWGAQ